MTRLRMLVIVAAMGALLLGLVACEPEPPPTPTPEPVVEPEEEAPPEVEEEPAPASIGDFVWHDTDQDGIQDDPEPAMPQVAVELYDSDDVLVASATTDPDGGYSFTNVAPAEYYVQFTLPATYLFTQQDQGDDDSVDSDADPTTGETVLITLDPGATDLTWDAGMFEAEPPTPTPTLTPSPTPTHTPSPVTEHVLTKVKGSIPELRDGDVLLPYVYAVPGTLSDFQPWSERDLSALQQTLDQSVARGELQEDGTIEVSVPPGTYVIVVAWHGPPGGPPYYILVAEVTVTNEEVMNVEFEWRPGSN